MGDENRNDYDGIAEDIADALATFLGSAHEPPADFESDVLTITKDGFLAGVIRLQRLADRVDGLAEAHRSACK